ncbi:TPA: prepilin-type N-terminal cleavage/methylation domain-containing protein [Vibrio vulnificus]|uniref:pilus assembly FimT family protein n=1 Tax=Vibrio vulnificus TaxID=672 RepID=UPI0005C3D6B6|nr:GspH/FimT family pseudopilin [Vibrio vulnificus]PWY34075.1 prepilin-type N-terminal cleavage/methylation domain-containing protein [Vibrio vulnificus]HAS6063127.1 prepilin-type N-terminal cleavage/methylation domain-containing protein [Vibrio vulnificus]HAS6064987.1 prepilin-type N-terminal cleavage/methylation domain-containing protein [Vibrio vulnificus]
MTRGFTLLELLITVAVLAVVLASAAPSFTRVSQTVEMQRLASELNGFFNQSKSEAVLRNTKLYVHFTKAKAEVANKGQWSLKLSASSSSASNVLLYLSGSSYSGLSIIHNYEHKYISFDPVRGRPQGGSIFFYPTSDETKKLSVVISNPPGRVRVCSLSGAKLYDYPTC